MSSGGDSRDMDLDMDTRSEPGFMPSQLNDDGENSGRGVGGEMSLPSIDSYPFRLRGQKLVVVPGEGSLLDYFDLPSPPNSVMLHRTLSPFPTPPTSPVHPDSSMSPHHNRLASSPLALNPPLAPADSSPPTQSMASMPSHLSQPMTPPPSNTDESSSSSESSPELGSPSAGGRRAPNRRTPYYPPNSSRTVDRTRIYMNRGPHALPNWTPLTSLPRHVQLQIEDRMVKFTAP
ncbi:hypothetical protein B0T24DRAFT_677231 [Lasiosphaeria ovina]|uniref:Uncharacterized protein n=1 Tax=Lasiosphaeria ovina TaxID=92902 RepID=A0AAE0KGX8_9PEZI|nr:hypothetical protein B0T24DRAFT_677231 [Lasiosphaeria ovina]